MLSRIRRPYYVSTYALMEFYRAVIVLFIDLYFEAERDSHPTFSDACRKYRESFRIRQVKTLVDLVLELVGKSGLDLASQGQKELCRRKVLHVVFELASELDGYKEVGESHEACAKLRSKLTLAALEEPDRLRKFVRTFKNDKEARGKCAIHKLLSTSKFQAAFQCVTKEKDRKWEKFVQNVRERVEHPRATTCTSCSKIGDAVITANAPDHSTIHTVDRVFDLTGRCFGKEVRRHPSQAELLREES